MTDAYVGRFAPSPTGPLHAGSLVAALASYLDARAAGGRWLVRIEDIDPPREIPGSSDLILRQLEAHGLLWDGEVCYQSQRQQLYLQALEALAKRDLLFACNCSREFIRSMGGNHTSNCGAGTINGLNDIQIHVKNGSAIRVDINAQPVIRFDDLLKGPQHFDLRKEGANFVVRRKDGLFAYQLAVAVDDAAQQISHVIRGGDLLSSTPRQIFILNTLHDCLDTASVANLKTSVIPRYGHTPVVVNTEGQKLSKQNKATEISLEASGTNLYRALKWLNQEPPQRLLGAEPEELLQWGIQHWCIDKIRKMPNKTLA